MSESNDDDFVFCETLAATGAWHIRRLGGAKKISGLPFGEDRRTLCNLRASWDINCKITEASLNSSRDEPGHTCSSCKKKYLEHASVSETPKNLTDFVKEHVSKKSIYWLKRKKRSRVYQTVGHWKQSTADMASVLHRAACHDLKDKKLDEAYYGVTIRTGTREFTKHFLLQRTTSPKGRCEDCRGSGWYVGIVERRPCPTCDGTGRESK